MSDLDTNIGTQIKPPSYSHGYPTASNPGGRLAPAGPNVMADLLGNYNVNGKTQNFIANTTAQILLQSNPRRVGFSIQNQGGYSAFIAFGVAPAFSNFVVVGGIEILPGAYFSYESIFCPANEIYVIADDITRLTLSELVKI